MAQEHRIVDNRTFLLGLDQLYSDSMRRHERGELLRCARRVAATLQVAPAAVPVEGYYAEDEQLTEYFCLIRALQTQDADLAPAVTSLPEFQRLLDVMSSPLYGLPQLDKLLPVGRDSLWQALSQTFPEWSVTRLTATAYAVARETDEISLVGLASLAQDAVVLAALRESVVLYAEEFVGSADWGLQHTYVWKVDEELEKQARRFIVTFNALFGEALPPPELRHAESYWHACETNEILGRCVRLAHDDTVSPARQYHWAICHGDSGALTVQEFWHSEVWTTSRYRSALRHGGGCPTL